MKKFVQKYLRNTRRGGKEIGSNETFPRTVLSKNKMFVSAANRGERGVRSVPRKSQGYRMLGQEKDGEEKKRKKNLVEAYFRTI